ncbi:MAG: hypothetical protein NTY35_12580 [Planctomycetota bacterium]|nr:hypothetical protein [Planctomycetota bacterium]
MRTTLQLACVLAALAGTAHAQGDVARISVDSSGLQANAGSDRPSLSHDGRYAAFSSTATNLVAGGTSGARHVYLRDRLTATTTLITRHMGVEANGDSGAPVLSADGRFVAFHTTASNLGPVDVNGFQDVYLYDVQADAFTLVSNGGFGGGGATGGSCCPGISPDGRWIAFYSGASDVVLNDLNIWSDAFVFDRTNLGAPVQLVSLGPGGASADFHSGYSVPGPTSGQIAVASNPNGTDCYVAFQSTASNLVPGADNGFLLIFLRDTQLASTSLVSANSAGAPASGACTGVSMSADGRFAVFNSAAPNLVAGDTLFGDTYVRDRLAGTTTKVSRSSQQVAAAGGPMQSLYPHPPSISADARFVAFESSAANLVPNDTNDKNSVFVRDLVENRTWRFDTGPTGAQADDECIAPCISGDGSVAAFVSPSTNLVIADTNAAADVFVERLRPTTYGYCFGDGSGAACPCANTGGPEKGCGNSFAAGGALLLGIGTTSVSSDTFLLAASAMTPFTRVLFIQGASEFVQPFGDGLRCVGSPFLRLGGRTASAQGACAYGSGVAGDPRVSTAGAVPAAGGTRTYQAWYRNAAAFCTPSTFNLTNGLRAIWTP